MAYDEKLASRVRRRLAARPELDEKRMFGGICFLLGGHMCCGVQGDDLMVRVQPEAYASTLARPGARPMDFTGRPLRGLVYVAGDAVASPRALDAWVDRAADFAASLPARAPKDRARTKRGGRSAKP